MSRTDDLKIHLSQLGAIEESLSIWMQERSSTLTWNIRLELVEQASKVESDRKISQDILESIKVPVSDDLIRERKKFTSTIRNTFLVLFLLIGGFLLLRAYFPVIGPVQLLLGISNLEIILYGVYFFLFTYLSAMIAYYSGWSRYKRRVNIAQDKINAHLKSLAHLRDETQRLKSLHAQAVDWYRLLSLVLIEPWTVDKAWFTDPADGLDVDQIPLAVRFAKAHSGPRSIQNQLERNTLEKVVRKGWRTEALNNLIKAASVEMGLDPESFRVEMLDSDLPEASNGARSAFFKQFMLGDIKSIAGEQTIKKVATIVREKVIPGVSTPVKSLHHDSLADLDWTYGGGSEDNWSGFFFEIFGEQNKKAPAFSVLPLTSDGMSKAVHEGFESYAFVPMRMKLAEPGVQVIEQEVDSPQWIDLSVRIDLSGPYSPKNFTVVSGEVLSESTSENKNNLADLDATNEINVDGGFEN
jgi:hypothetical protein